MSGNNKNGVEPKGEPNGTILEGSKEGFECEEDSSEEDKINPLDGIYGVDDVDKLGEGQDGKIPSFHIRPLNSNGSVGQKVQEKSFLKKPVSDWLDDIDNAQYFPLFEKLQQLINNEEVFNTIVDGKPGQKPKLEGDLFDYTMMSLILKYAEASPEDRLVNKDGEVKMSLLDYVYRALAGRFGGIQEKIIEPRYGSLLKDVNLQLEKNDLRNKIIGVEKKEWLHKGAGFISTIATAISIYAGLYFKNTGNHELADLLLYAATPAGIISILAEGFAVPYLFSRKRKNLEDKFDKCDKEMGALKTARIIDEIDSKLKEIKYRLEEDYKK